MRDLLFKGIFSKLLVGGSLVSFGLKSRLKMLFSFLAFFLQFNLLAQRSGDYLFRTDFNSNEQSFYLGSYPEMELSVKDGIYLVDVKRLDTIFAPSYYLPVESDKDFVIGASFKCIAGIREYGIGFGGRVGSIKTNFLINDHDQTLTVFRENLVDPENKKGEFIIRGKPTDLIKRGEYNSLLIEKIGDKVYFFINYKIACSVPFQPYIGRSFGIFVVGGQKIACDYFYVKQKRRDINLIDNYQQFDSIRKLEEFFEKGSAQTLAVISADEEIVYYQNGRYKDSITTSTIYFSKKTTNGNWQKPKKLPIQQNTPEESLSIAGVSEDGNEILMSTAEGFSILRKKNNTWTSSDEKHFAGLGPFMNEAGVSASSDFKVMVLSLQLEETYGVNDLYVSFFRNGAWTKPLNLGKDVNSFGDDVGPFLAADNTTLYFASDGWPGYGALDIFMTKRLDETWTHWSEPKNLGPLINTKKGEAYFAISSSGKEGFFARGVSSDRYFHLFGVTPPSSAAPEPFILVKGRILDSQSRLSMSAKITCSVQGESKTFKEFTCDQRGLFAISLPKGKRYVFTAHKEGFIAELGSRNTVDLTEYRKETVELLLSPFRKGALVVMHNLIFENNQDRLLPGSEVELKRLLDLMKKYPTMRVEIRGHTQINNLPPDYNQNLSLRRAKTVRDYLTGRGVSPSRVEANGYGNTLPLDRKTDEESQAKNRRVEFRILER